MDATNCLLIVDDEPDITRLIEIAARELGFDVLAINETHQFEKALGTIKPTIIMLDIAMPERDGMELIGHLAASNFAGKVVVISGSDPRALHPDERDNRQDTRPAGCWDTAEAIQETANF